VTASVTISGENTPPIAAARANPTSGSDPLIVNFDGSYSSDPDGRIVSYFWDFGDGSWERTAKANHQYRNMGSYTAVLTVTDDKEATAKDEILITVGNEPPVAAIVVSPQEGTRPLSVTFDGSGSRDRDDAGLTFSWDFGDGGSGSGMTTGHTYIKEGTYHASLLVTDPHGAWDTEEATVEVKPPFPWIDVFFIVPLIIVGPLIARHYFRKPQKRKFPDPEVNIDVQSGVECPVGKGGELPDISVEVRSGIWKEGEKR
jgi:PKD repeat protein